VNETPRATQDGPRGLVPVLLVDDHAGLRAGLVRLIHGVGGYRVVEAADGAQALERLAEGGLDVAIIDMSMPGMSGFELIESIRRQGLALPVLMLSMHDEEPYALRAVRAGAQGYLMKDRVGEELLPALQRLHDGGLYLSTAVAARLRGDRAEAAAVAPHARLSARELEVLQRLSRGEPERELARSMGLTGDVVLNCIERIQSKLRLPSQAALVRYGVEHGLGAPSPTAASTNPLTSTPFPTVSTSPYPPRVLQLPAAGAPLLATLRR
jgi:DNA-binding NarL/FixJ family response regulator